MWFYFAAIILLICQDSYSDLAFAEFAFTVWPLNMACISHASDKKSKLLYTGSWRSSSTMALLIIVAYDALWNYDTQGLQGVKFSQQPAVPYSVSWSDMSGTTPVTWIQYTSYSFRLKTMSCTSAFRQWDRFCIKPCKPHFFWYDTDFM